MKKLALILFLAALTACGIGGGKGAPERYHLTAKPIEAKQCRGNQSIKFHTPNPAPGIDSWRIVVMDKPNHLTVYQGVVWSATASRLVQNYIADSFEQSGMFQTVSTDYDMLPADYEVEIELREFHVDLTGEPSVRIRLTANVTRADGAHIVKSLKLARTAPIAGAKMQGIVEIFSEQMHNLTQEMQQKLSTAIPGCR